MMMERTKLIDKSIPSCSSLKFLFVFLLKLEIVTGGTRNRTFDNKASDHLCYTCVEPLVGYTDHKDSCRRFNVASPVALSYIQECNDDGTGEYECRKLVISYRSVETYLRRDCVPKGLCSWKDKTRSMIDRPVSDCVYTDDETQKLECIYCCNTPLCNRSISYHILIQLIMWLLLINWWRRREYQ